MKHLPMFLTGLLVASVIFGGAMELTRPASGAENVSAMPYLAVTAAAVSTPSAGEKPPQFEIQRDGRVVVENLEFENLSAYFTSDYFQQTGKRCGTQVHSDAQRLQADPGDCSLARTRIQSEYWPNEVYVIPIVFHIIYADDGTGNISDQRINDQVQVLNEDYQAVAGSLGAAGFNTQIHFQLAEITRTQNEAWFNDEDELAYKQALGWDQDHYLNVYLNTAGGDLGYSYLPQDNEVKDLDGVVLLYETVGGRNTGYDVYDQGRSLVHEIGHYLGLLHTFEGYGCYDGYEAGDLIADTPSENDAHFDCEQTFTCGTPDDIHNYMNYTDDICMRWFTREQANRAVCTLINYRPQLFEIGALTVTQQVSPDPVQAGAQLTYTLYVTNTGEMDLHTQVVDTLPAHVLTGASALTGGTLQWTPTITAPGGVWTETVVVTVALSYAGTLTNVVQVTSAEGVAGVYTATTTVTATATAPQQYFYLPLIARNLGFPGLGGTLRSRHRDAGFTDLAP